MSVVWKFPLDLSDEQEIVMPRGAELLHVDLQAGGLSLWARVDPEAPQGGRLILLRGTGTNDALEDEPHIGTVQIPPFVWHLFDGGERQ